MMDDAATFFEHGDHDVERKFAEVMAEQERLFLTLGEPLDPIVSVSLAPKAYAELLGNVSIVRNAAGMRTLFDVTVHLNGRLDDDGVWGLLLFASGKFYPLKKT